MAWSHGMTPDLGMVLVMIHRDEPFCCLLRNGADGAQSIRTYTSIYDAEYAVLSPCSLP
jgi:hypothetical protein